MRELAKVKIVVERNVPIIPLGGHGYMGPGAAVYLQVTEMGIVTRIFLAADRHVIEALRVAENGLEGIAVECRRLAIEEASRV